MKVYAIYFLGLIKFLNFYKGFTHKYVVSVMLTKFSHSKDQKNIRSHCFLEFVILIKVVTTTKIINNLV